MKSNQKQTVKKGEQNCVAIDSKERTSEPGQVLEFHNINIGNGIKIFQKACGQACGYINKKHDKLPKPKLTNAMG